ncbi:unnamed protein product [Symbiodinium necroappetens]|uniref:PDZ domain-containing protein n=1 Tax=Symbiodinium necroappetens TaxID=1628268 RepID=A0A813CGD8_9DINO|nr:unnamed protein product [Symbiodinium necroappetens]
MSSTGKTVVVQLDRSGGSQFGMHVHGANLTVCSIDTGGVAAAWNQQNPLWAIGIGDRILAVNGVRSREVILEQLSTAQVISILLLKSTTGPSLPRPFSNFSAQLARLAHEDFGLEVNAGTMEVTGLQSDGQAAMWNLNHPFQAMVVGDRLVEVNGLHGESMASLLQEALLVDMVLQRGTGIASFGTFGIRLPPGDSVGLEMNKVLEVQKIDAGSLVAKWNAENPACRLHAGDKVLQANGKATAPEILRELSASARTGLTLVVAEAERRMDVKSRQVYTFKDCQKEWPKDPEQEWASMVSADQASVPSSPHAWAVRLRRSESHGWGLTVDPKSLQVQQISDEGPMAFWNLSNASSAVLTGDRIAQVNGADQGKAMLQIMKQAAEIDMYISRDTDLGSTAHVHLLKVPGSKLGVQLNEDAVVKQVLQGPGKLVAAWNSKQPAASMRSGDVIKQAGPYTSLERIFLYLQEQQRLDLIVLRAQRRMDLDGTVLTFEECSAKHSAAAAHWATMHPVPAAPVAIATPVSYQGLQQAEEQTSDIGSYTAPRSLLKRPDFYSTLAGWQTRGPQALASEAITHDNIEIPAGSVFACPCCGRFFALTEASGVVVSLAVGPAEALSPMKAAGDSSTKDATTVPPRVPPQIGDVSEQALPKAELQKCLYTNRADGRHTLNSFFTIVRWARPGSGFL